MKKIALLLGSLALLLVVSCNSKTEEKEAAVKFTVTNPIQIDTTFTKEYVSQIRSVRDIELRAQEKGFLQNIYVDEGQFVREGQLLFKIMPKMYEAELLKAQAEEKAAEVELQNAKLLAEKNVISKSEQAIAQAKVEKARAEVSLAKLHLSFTNIKAPFSGTIDRLPKKLGSLIDEGELLTTLSDNRNIYVYFNISEPEYIQYQTDKNNRADNNVELLMANGELLPTKGKVEVIESEFDSETGTIPFRAIFQNPNKILKNGETGKIRMKVPLKNVVVIPQKATYEIQDKKYVFVVDKNNIIKSREIIIKGEMPDLYVIDNGITVGDKIVLDGLQKANDNDKIQYEYKKPIDVFNQLRLRAE